MTVVASPLPACSSDSGTTPGTSYSEKPEDQARVYPQGLASGDPKPDSVILWTRAVPNSGSGAVKVIYEVALDEAFKQIVAKGDVTTDDTFDWTLRIKVTGLQAFTKYYYRFKAQAVLSITGQTKTAPADDQDVPVRFAFASCQDFVGRYYFSWQAFLQEAPVDFVLWLGDYIYETNGDPAFQTSTSDRKIEIPDGIQLDPANPDVKAASSLTDYRGVYKQYRSDANLQKAHSLYPFIFIWDDHEFANDCWQDHATDFNEKNGPEKEPERRHAASQAWFEYQPADVTFDASAASPNDIKIFRTLRYGKHVELFMTDQRSYRSDHVIPEGAAGSGKPAGAPDYLTYSTAFKLQQYSELGSRNFVRKAGKDAAGHDVGFDPIEALVKPAMLGSEQKQWFLDAIKGSTATWKVWANEVQLLQMTLDLSPFKIPALFSGIYYFTVDQWDGYRTERKEILDQIKDVKNLLVVTGDIHAFYAGELHVDFDNPGPTPIGVEYVCAGISSSPAQEITATAVLKLDPNGSYGLKDLVPNFDQILAASSPHYKYTKSMIHGIATVDVNTDQDVEVTFIQIADVKTKDWNGQVERVKFRTLSGSNKVEKI